ncbi:MAG: long-chain fatty acid--CoA ligase [Actinobacteria bacterium]|nr:long-chain fatty acid--CoA ligase [Actinomycetota bacterium]
MTSTNKAAATMASLADDAAARYPDHVAARHRSGDGWTGTTYAQLGEMVRPLAKGLLRAGVGPGDRVCILSNTRFEWTVANLAVSATGAIVVPIYPTSSPDECQWVAGDSGARMVIAEDANQVAKIETVRDGLPALEHVVLIDGDGSGLPTLDSLAADGQDHDDSELRARIDAVTLDDPYLIIYTSGTTGRPKGVVLTHGGFAEGRRIVTELGLVGPGDVVYLYLPLAHVFAQLIQADVLEVGATIGYFGGDTTQIVSELSVVKPTVLPSVPRIFEKIYTMATQMVTDDARDDFQRAVDAGVRLREAEHRGDEPSEADKQTVAAADEVMFGLVRSLFGGELKFAISGAAPIAPEILRFFYAAGAPVYEGWGMTETSSLGTINLPDAYKFGTIGRPQPGVEMKIADDGEILIRGPVVFKEYWNNPAATAETIDHDGWMHTGDLGHVDDEGYFTITGRKKDIIITAGGKNLTPANLEGDLRQSPWISQAVMYADRRPYPVALITLDPETIVPWAEGQGLPTDIASLADRDEVRAMIQSEVDRVNANYAKVEQIKRFRILDHDFSQETGELTPTLKLKRNVVYREYVADFDELYE